MTTWCMHKNSEWFELTKIFAEENLYALYDSNAHWDVGGSRQPLSSITHAIRIEARIYRYGNDVYKWLGNIYVGSIYRRISSITGHRMWSYLNNSRHTYRSSNLPIDLVTTFTNGMGIYILYKYLPREIKKDFVKGKTGNEVI